MAIAINNVDDIAETVVPDAPHRVLIVDDSKLHRRILSSSVKRWGFKVFEAASGEEAIKICDSIAPDIVISDWMMPGMNGLEFCDAFRMITTDRYGYFILLSSKGEKKRSRYGPRGRSR